MNQVQYILKQYFSGLPEPEPDPMPPMMPQKPFQKPMPQAPMMQQLEKLNDLSTVLNIVETNYREHRITLTEAVRTGDKFIEVHMKRIYGAGYEPKREEEFRKWTAKLMGMQKVEGKTYSVTVD